MSGDCAIGNTKRERMPANVVKIAVTPASRRPATKPLESTGSAPGRRRRNRGGNRAGAHGRTRPQAFHPLHDYLLAAGKIAVKNRVGTLFAADLDAADLGFAVVDDKEIGTLLIG